MNKNDESIFRGIWETAQKKAEAAADAVSNPQKLFSRGGIEVFDKRRKFTRWLIQTRKGFESTRGVYCSGGGGQWYSQANAYAKKFCEELEKFGIKCKNDVGLD